MSIKDIYKDLCDNINCSVDDGWLPLVDDYLNFIRIIKQNTNIIIDDIYIKQKFAVIRIYEQILPDLRLHNSYQQVNKNLVEDDMKKLFFILNEKKREIEKKSSITCEVCGDVGSLVNKNSFLRTLCSKHK